MNDILKQLGMAVGRYLWQYPKMNPLEILLSTVTTSALIGVVLFLARNLITTRLAKSVQNEFDAKLAGLNSRLRISEDSLKADLQRKEAEILALQSGAMQSRLSRLVAIDKRRLEAVDQLWDAVYDLSFAKATAGSVSILKLEAIGKEIERNPKVKEIFAVFKIDEAKYSAAGKLAQRARPFITPVAWAYFAAYQAILMYAVALIKILQIGIDPTRFMDSKSLISLITAALPHCTEYIEKHGPTAAYYLLDQLENSLLEELKRMLDGGTTDLAEVSRAQQILVEVSRVNREVSESQSSASSAA
ncbi:hypothetical protein [Polaromonas sp. YR568]|uniref:hypothetical protein n=1 Tax=Polaromonas sp. YR568 TaxID=1855301 RepID=UPI0031378DE8